MADANTVKAECPVSNKPDVSINLVKDDDTPLPMMEPISNTSNAVNCTVNGAVDSIVNGDAPIAAEEPKNIPIIPNSEPPKVTTDSIPTDKITETPEATEAVKPVETVTPPTQPEIVQTSVPIIPKNEEQKVVTEPTPIDKIIEAPVVVEEVKPVESIPVSSTNGPEIAAVPEVEVKSNSIPVSNCVTGNSEPLTNNIKSEELDKAAPSCENATKHVIPVVSEDEWARRESILLEQIAILQKEQGDTSIKGYQLQLKVKTEENYILKAKIINLETELSAVLKKPNAKNKDIVEKIKKQHDDLLTQARGMLFDKTKMIKNQELQIEALGNQVTSLKEVVTITKDLLSIRNMEVEHLQQRMECMDLKIKAERERHALLISKIDTGTKVNEELKKEYEAQLAIFKELKSKYEEKFQTLERNQIQPTTSQDQS